MIRYLGAAIVVAVTVIWLWHLDRECEADGGMLMRGAFKPVCIKHLDVVR